VDDQAPEEHGELRIEDDRERSRFEVFVDGAPAGFTEYHAQPGLITLLHTEIDPAFEGRGVGSRFVAGVLDEIRARGEHVLPICPFVRAFLQRHPAYADLVAYA
jgi:predicted GNAT family acetyltransferase